MQPRIILKWKKYFFIDSYLDCASIFSGLKENDSENHILAYTSDENADLYSCFYMKKGFNTITFVKKEHDNDYKLITFDCASRKTKIYLANCADSINVKYELMQNWLDTYFFRPNCYFSYCNRDGYSYLMDELNNKTNYYFPFLCFQRDSDNNKSFSCINDYVDELISGSLVVLLIGYEYLKSYHPMYELASILDQEIFSKNISINLGITELAKKGCFILINKEDQNIDKFIFHSSDNEFEKFWESELYNNKKYPPEKLEKIVSSIGKIKLVLSSINSIYSIDKHQEDGFATLLTKISQALEKRPLYVDIYDKRYPWKSNAD